MVHVVVVGGAGNVGREIVEELVTQGKHEVTVFSQRELPVLSDVGIQTRKVNYYDKVELAADLKDVHTVLSFVSADPDNTAQKNLIDACVEAGVKRFAPSEWGIISDSGFSGYAFKDEVHDYLKQVNADGPVLEYCLFQPGMFMNYLGYPYKTAKHLFINCVFMDVENRHALQVEDGDYWLAHTSIQDVARVVARAIDYPGKWPETGGMVGTRIQMKKLIKLAERIRGEPIEIHKVKEADLEKNELRTTWVPDFDHPNMPRDMVRGMARMVLPGALNICGRGAFDVSPTWNQLLPDMKFTDIESFLAGVFGG